MDWEVGWASCHERMRQKLLVALPNGKWLAKNRLKLNPAKRVSLSREPSSAKVERYENDAVLINGRAAAGRRGMRVGSLLGK